MWPALPTTPAELAYPPGDAWAARAAAGELRDALGRLATARRAAEHVGRICDGAEWRGEAFEAFRLAVDRKPLPEALDRARCAMEEAAGRLEWFAARFDTNTRTIGWCRSRLLSLGIADGSVPEELVAEVERIARDAEAAWDDHRAALAAVAATFDRLDDEPTFATPPRSGFEQVVGAVGAVGDFGVGVLVGAGEGVWELGVLGGQLALLANPGTAPIMWRRIWNAREQVGAVLAFAWDDPGSFGLEIGKAVIDLDTWTEDGVARWIGHRIPDIVLAVSTAGYGTAGAATANAVRTLRGARAADAVLDTAGVGHLFARTAPVPDAAAAARLLGEGRLGTRLAGLGADPARLDRATEAGAFNRTDTALGRLGARVDASSARATARQLPGRINDEIKGFTRLPDRYVQQRFAGTAVAEHVSPTLQRRLDAFLTDGWTDRLGMLDGLLVGSSGLSPQTQAAMVGVLGVDLTNRLGSAGMVFSAVHADARSRGDEHR